jgi:hypothetical protein
VRIAFHSTLFLLLLSARSAVVASPESPDSLQRHVTEVGSRPERMLLEEKDWRARTEELDYTETYKSRDSAREDEADTSASPSVPRLDSLKYFYYALILGGIVFLVWRLVRSGESNPSGTRLRPATTGSRSG